MSNYPLKEFAEAIGGDTLKVHFLAPPDVDPAFWEPTPADVKQMQAADILLFNGATYEKWAVTTTLQEDRIVDTGAAFAGTYIVLKDAVTHSHGPGGMHSHSGTSFTTWLDPQQAIQHAEAIAAAFTAQRPEKAAEYAARLDALKKKLATLDERFAAIVAGKTDRPLMASHPVYDYFARRYSLDLRAVLWEPEELPSDEEWAELHRILAEHPAKLMIWEGEPLEETTKKLAAEGVTPVVFETMMNAPESGDYFSHMEENAKRLEAAFQ